MQIKCCRFTCIKLATKHEGTVNLKKIDQAVSELEHQIGLAEVDLGLAPGYVPEVLDEMLVHMRQGLDPYQLDCKVW